MSILNNKILIISALSWFVAGFIKMLIELFIYKELDLKRILGSGGMPSSHTATVVGLVIATCRYEGVESSLFAFTVILAIIVIHDAIGVRFETGKQAKLLNQMMTKTDVFNNIEFEKTLKEYIGHTPLQALVGGIIGVLTSIIMIKVLG